MKYIVSICLIFTACSNNNKPDLEAETPISKSINDTIPLSYDELKANTVEQSDSLKEINLKTLTKLVYPFTKFKSDTTDFSDIRENGALYKSFTNLYSVIKKNSDTAQFELTNYVTIYELLEKQLVRRTEAQPKPSIDIKEMLMIAKVKSDINTALAQIKQKARQ